MTEGRVSTLPGSDVSVRKSIVVETSQQRAFEVFTAGVDSWWMREYHIGQGAPLDEMVVELKEGGRCYGRDADGEWDWGKVLTYEPPDRVIFAWQLTADWKFDPDLETEVEVRFIEEGPNRTRVELEHRDLERFGDSQQAVRERIDSPGGWPRFLEEFAKAAESA